MTNPNPLIIPPASVKPAVTITITFDPVTGQTELKCNQALNSLAIAGILSEHVSGIIRQIVQKSSGLVGAK